MLESERLTLRRFVESDAEVFFTLNSDPEIVRYTGRRALSCREEALRVLASDEFRADEKRGLGRFACVEKASGHVIGSVGLKVFPELDCVDIGFRFLVEAWGKGYAREAAALLVKYGHEILQLERIVATTFPDNVASISVLERLGFTFLERLRLHTLDDALLLYEKVREA